MSEHTSTMNHVADQDRLPLKRLLGRSLRNRAGDRLGRVDDVLIDARRGRIEAVILLIDRPGDSGEARIAIPWSQTQTADGELELDVSRSVLHRAFGLSGRKETS